MELHKWHGALSGGLEWNAERKFAIPATITLYVPTLTNLKNQTTAEQMKPRNVSQAVWKFQFALEPRYRQNGAGIINHAHIGIPKKGNELASVNRGPRQVADMKGKSQNDAGAPSSDSTPPAKTPPSEGKSNEPALGESNVGSALRSVYQQTIDEDIPSEMLDLLKKLT